METAHGKKPMYLVMTPSEEVQSLQFALIMTNKVII